MGGGLHTPHWEFFIVISFMVLCKYTLGDLVKYLPIQRENHQYSRMMLYTLGVFRTNFIHGAKHTLGDLIKNQKDADMNGISPLI